MIVTASKPPAKTSIYPLGKKHYETTDRLGNVRVTYTDKKSWQQNKFALNVSSSQDYYPFGSVMEGRKYNLSAYRYAFNTQERVPELNESHYTALYWEYDGRLARRWNVDPKPMVYISGYSVMANNPIWYNDVLGDTVLVFIDKEGAGGQGHMGMAFQNGKGEWFYASQGAVGNPGQSELLAGSNAQGGIDLIPLKIQEKVPVVDDKGNPTYDDKGNAQYKIVLRNPSKNEVIQIAKSGRLGYQYDDYVQLNTNSVQDEKISQNANKIAQDFRTGKQKYNVYFNNCVDACQQIIQGGTDIDLPIDFDPRPNSYFEKLKKFESEFNK
ncbi:MAG: hypothetical protein KatS3mg035_2225 [Bacteroidia bacterium]|nr:MAG: hypothetical protein KatS3mg035_2225 [Bacteroidia bacterium]